MWLSLEISEDYDTLFTCHRNNNVSEKITIKSFWNILLRSIYGCCFNELTRRSKSRETVLLKWIFNFPNWETKVFGRQWRRILRGSGAGAHHPVKILQVKLIIYIFLFILAFSLVWQIYVRIKVTSAIPKVNEFAKVKCSWINLTVCGGTVLTVRKSVNLKRGIYTYRSEWITTGSRSCKKLGRPICSTL
jgi:hypothetical protein